MTFYGNPDQTKRFIWITGWVKVLTGTEIDLIFHSSMNFAVYNTVSFFSAE